MVTTAPGLQRPKARPSLQTPHFPEKGILASEQEAWGEGVSGWAALPQLLLRLGPLRPSLFIAGSWAEGYSLKPFPGHSEVQ